MRLLLINSIDALAISLFLYLLVAFRNSRRRRGLSYPPGPPSWPISGNFLAIPKAEPWIAYTDMSKKYGKYDVLNNTDSPQLNCDPHPRRYHLPSLFFSSHSRVVFVLGH